MIFVALKKLIDDFLMQPIYFLLGLIIHLIWIFEGVHNED